MKTKFVMNLLEKLLENGMQAVDATKLRIWETALDALVLINPDSIEPRDTSLFKDVIETIDMCFPHLLQEDDLKHLQSSQEPNTVEESGDAQKIIETALRLKVMLKLLQDDQLDDAPESAFDSTSGLSSSSNTSSSTSVATNAATNASSNASFSSSSYSSSGSEDESVDLVSYDSDEEYRSETDMDSDSEDNDSNSDDSSTSSSDDYDDESVELASYHADETRILPTDDDPEDTDALVTTSETLQLAESDIEFEDELQEAVRYYKELFIEVRDNFFVNAINTQVSYEKILILHENLKLMSSMKQDFEDFLGDNSSSSTIKLANRMRKSIKLSQELLRQDLDEFVSQEVLKLNNELERLQNNPENEVKTAFLDQSLDITKIDNLMELADEVGGSFEESKNLINQILEMEQQVELITELRSSGSAVENFKLLNKFRDNFKNQLKFIKDKEEALRKEGYSDAADTANTLYQKLSANYDKLSLRTMGVFKENCRDVIEEARPKLESHRGWKLALSYLLLSVTVVGILVVGVDIGHKLITGRHLSFFQTNSARQLSELEREVERIPELSR